MATIGALGLGDGLHGLSIVGAIIECFERCLRNGEMSELAEGARLEIVCTPKRCTEGSNPSLSAIFHFSSIYSGYPDRHGFVRGRIGLGVVGVHLDTLMIHC